MIATQFIPIEAQKIAIVLLLSFLIGLEHEEHKRADQTHYMFGGVRTFPLLGILGYTTALLSAQYPALLAVGLGAIGALMFLSFQHKLGSSQTAGITSEASGILTFLLGAVVYQEHYWIATTLVVLGVMLLELKVGLEGLVRNISPAEILTFTKFLLLAAVILPILPNIPITRFQFNPQQVWLIVVGISAISYASYILQRLIGDRGTIPSALLGGAYSSTAATIALSKRSAGQGQPRLYAGAILASSGVMYLRLAILVSIFSTALRIQLAPWLGALGAVTVAAGVLFARLTPRPETAAEGAITGKNPLALHSAFLFAGLFLGMFVLTHLVLESIGTVGVYGLSILTGVTDVDPFILGLTQSAARTTPVPTAIAGILLAAASNNFAKGVYARAFAERDTGKLSLLLLSLLAVAGLLPLIYFI